jgi:hypothetical protein
MDGYVPPLPRMPSGCVQVIVIIFTVLLFIHLITRYMMMQGQTSSPNTHRVIWLRKICFKLRYLLR